MPDDYEQTQPLIGRIAAMEVRFSQFEEKTSRIEGKLDELVRSLGSSAQSTDDRIEKIVAGKIQDVKDQQADKLEGIKEKQTEYKTKIDALEGGRRFNLVATVTVIVGLFSIFAYFSNQSAESTRALVSAQGNLTKLELQTTINNLQNAITATQSITGKNVEDFKRASEKDETDRRDYEAFKALVTQQNAASIQQRSDQADAIKTLTSALSTVAGDLHAFISKTDQKTAEIETQFYLEGQDRNIQFSDQQRKNSELQNAIHDLGGKMPTYPTAPFFQPNVSGRHDGGSGQ